MTLIELQSKIRVRLNELRSLERIVQSVQFSQCLLLDQNNLKLSRAIQEADLEGVREWMANVIETELCELSIRQLRALASQLGIKSYTGLPKDDLLILIIQVKSNEAQSFKDHAVGMSFGPNGTQTIPNKS